jgi:hypothetical protein
MKTFLKIAAWIIAALAGLFIWHAFPDLQPVVTWALGAAFIYHLVSTLVKDTVKEVLNEELFELRRRSIATEEHLEGIDRKVSALLRDALEQRRARL